MDSLTQIVLGASVGEAVLGKKVGNKAMLYGAIAGTIPDLDVLSSNFVNTVTAIEWHRGFTHSIFFSVLFAPIFGWVVCKIEKGSNATFEDWSWLMFWGLLTHPILDAFTTWGTQLFWPFDWRVAFQTIFVVDPLYTLPFLGFVVLAMLQSRDSPKRKLYNQWGLTISSFYLVLTVASKGLSFNKFKSALADEGIEYVNLNTRPTPFNTLLWSANVDVGDAYLVGNYSFLDSENISFQQYPKNHTLIGDLKTNDDFNRLVKITQGWYTLSEREGTLFLNDLRFGLISLDPDETRFAFSYRLEQEGDKLIISEEPRRRDDAKGLLKALWNRIWGN
ncbi:metal-dependent hydrolase [Euzebyella marina]|uniref:Metal-dependent hydrolase n=1 Tax=Euzebyella marina TaxID=1761453 RepID=A0A3G2L2G9_9FLAO|nr:metal-dependent hydrolase [Euzebyella marina]AYN66445.1 metal-dependent hydrolase [Euzebyella marina]